MNRQKASEIIILFFGVAGLFFLNGCATTELWGTNVDVRVDKSNYKKYQVFAETEQIYVGREVFTDKSGRNEYVKLYIPFRVTKDERQNKKNDFPPIESGYFVIKIPKKRSVYIDREIEQKQILKTILNSDWKMKCIDISKGSSHVISKGIYQRRDSSNIQFHYETPAVADDEIVFESDDLDIPANKGFECFSPVGSWAPRKIVEMLELNKKWRERFGNVGWKDSAGDLRLRPVAWIDSTGQYICDIRGTEPAGLLLVCKSDDCGHKYVKLMFDVPFFSIFSTGFLHTAEKKYSYTFSYSGPPSYDFSFVKDMDTSRLDPLIEQPNSRKMEIIFNDLHTGSAYSRSAPVRIVGTPFAVAFDIITSPIQLLLFCFFPMYN